MEKKIERTVLGKAALETSFFFHSKWYASGGRLKTAYY